MQETHVETELKGTLISNVGGFNAARQAPQGKRSHF
jgi:hypothetical protein